MRGRQRVKEQQSECMHAYINTPQIKQIANEVAAATTTRTTRTSRAAVGEAVFEAEATTAVTKRNLQRQHNMLKAQRTK